MPDIRALSNPERGRENRVPTTGTTPSAEGHADGASACAVDTPPGMGPFFPAGSKGPHSPRSRRQGLPAKVKKLRRTITSKVRLTAAEHHELQHRAAEAKLDGSTYLRLCALGRPPRIVPPVNAETFVELTRIGNNVNQIARRLNERSGDDPTTQELVLAYNTLLLLIKDIYCGLIGGRRLPRPGKP